MKTSKVSSTSKGRLMLALDMIVLVSLLVGIMLGSSMYANASLNSAPANLAVQTENEKLEIQDQQAKSMSLFGIEAVHLNENFSKVSLMADGTCSVDDIAPSSMPKLKDTWDALNEYSDIPQLSDLAILEQVKREIQKTKMVMPLNKNAKTELSIHYSNGRIQNLFLSSADSMFQTYPNARMLHHFMQVVMLMREVGQKCSQQANEQEQ